jgi:hypothetical protein
MTNTEWRELGPDEVICKGDEIQWPHQDWQAAKASIGYKVGYWDGLVKSRTRRPLPKQEEIPLDLDIKGIEEVAKHPLEPKVDFYICQLAAHLAHAIRYLRDEIQKLKHEPVTEKDIKVSVKEAAPEWREFGPDEVIQKGDEMLCDKRFVPCRNVVGMNVGSRREPRPIFRTRRPLPEPHTPDNEVATPSRRYTCRYCEGTYRRNNKQDKRKLPPICPSCATTWNEYFQKMRFPI